MPDFLPKDPNADTRILIGKAIILRESPERFVQLFHEDAVVHLVGSRQDKHFYGSHRGRAQILRILRLIDSGMEVRHRQILSVVVDGDAFATRLVVEMRHRGTSVVAKFMMGGVVRMRQGLIAEAFQYVDTSAIQLFDGDHE